MRAFIGKHRVKLVERLDPALDPHVMWPLISAEMIFPDHEAIRDRLVA